jgi:hypothetical protein
MDKNATWSIDTAISTVQKVGALGFKALTIFGTLTETEKNIEQYISSDGEKYDDVIQRISSSCWTGMDYFKMWLQDSCLDISFFDYHIKDLSKVTFATEGVYYVEFNGSESHYFVLIIKGNSIWYAGTYGGVCELVVKEFDRIDYHSRFINAMKGSMKDYAYVFQVKPEVNKVGFESLSFVKSPRYF